MEDLTQGPFVHEALLYRTPDDLLAGAVPFVEAGLARDEPVLVATPQATLNLLRGALPATNGRVQMLDMRRAGRNPGRILPAVLLAFTRAHQGRRVRIVGEPIWPGRGPLEYPACVQHEALINTAFAGVDAMIQCPYDETGLDQRAVDDAARTHPLVTTRQGRRPSPHFTDPVATAEDFNLPLPPPPAAAVTSPVELPALGELRQRVAEQARAAGLSPSREVDAVLAVNELASNTLDHGSGPGTLATWPENGYLVCQVSDHGHISDPLAGRVPPALDAAAGRGLFVVNQVCDLVRIHTEPGRTTVRVHLAAQ